MLIWRTERSGSSSRTMCRLTSCQSLRACAWEILSGILRFVSGPTHIVSGPYHFSEHSVAVQAICRATRESLQTAPVPLAPLRLWDAPASQLASTQTHQDEYRSWPG